MKNQTRGVVWEETIILLPDKVRYVFLSASIGNERMFAKWISELHKQPCHIVYTHKRPVPLKHYLFPFGGEELYQITEEERFCEDKFNEVMEKLEEGGCKKLKRNQKIGATQTNLYSI